MKKYLCIIMCSFISLSVFSQYDELFQMKKKETKHIKVNQIFTTSNQIPINEVGTISSFSISGKVKLKETESLIRVILVTEKHEYLVIEAYPLISDRLEFLINKFCDESSLIDDEKPLELIIIVKNAEFELKSIHFSEQRLNKMEKEDFSKLKQYNKELVEFEKASKINYSNGKKNKTWLAKNTELSLLPFEQKKDRFGGNYDFLTGGYEYYSEGIFSFETFSSTNYSSLKSALTSSYPTEFDWRNRHGEDWTTAISLQGDCGSCTAFAAVGVTEIMTNLYFNDHINIDLSEQEVWVCNSSGGSCSIGSGTYSKFTYIRDSGVSEESCFPYIEEDRSTLPCSTKCQNPSESISFSALMNVGSSIDEMKHHLIFNGPFALSVHYNGMNWHHAMVVIGYKVIEAGDYIMQVGPNGGWGYFTVQTGNPLIGQTYFIFKNSYPGNGGYHYIFFENGTSYMSTGYGIQTPITSLNYGESDRRCVDNDNDGYYNWGIGPKPATCPSCPDEPDGDDADPGFWTMDSFGNCLPLTITGNTTWTTTRTACGGVNVTSGGNLTLTGATVNLPSGEEFTVEIGGTLTINSGTIQ